MTTNEFKPNKFKVEGIKKNNVTTYYDEVHGTKLEIKGAVPAVRFNNPGNIECKNIKDKTGRWAVSQGAIGCAQGRAIFPDVETGSLAMRNNLVRKFGDYTVREMLLGDYEYIYGRDKMTPISMKIKRAGYCPEWYYDNKGVIKYQDTESYARYLEKGSDAKENDNLKSTPINELGSELFEKVVRKMMTWEGFYSPKNQGTKTLYNRNGKVIKLNELDKNLQEGVTPKKPTMLAYAKDVQTDVLDGPVQSAVREAKKQKMKEAFKLPEAEESAESDGDTEVSEEQYNNKADAGLSRKRLPANIGTDGPAGFPGAPDSPLQYALAALGVKPREVQFTPAEANDENKTPASFDIRDNDTSEKVGSYAVTTTGCEMTAGGRKVVMDRISGNDIHLQTYAKNDDGDFELLGTTRIGDNDGITVRRPWTGLA
jgi:hypothetical protein